MAIIQVAKEVKSADGFPSLYELGDMYITVITLFAFV